jgi:prepilin-type N-terminal cleavage/methylation domain-containing protein
MFSPLRSFKNSKKGGKMKSLFRKMHKGQGGFTLVELLVVFTLLGVLAGIMIPNISNLVGFGEANAARTELSVIQTAMDSMMAVEQQATVVPALINTNDMAEFPNTDHPLFPNYLRDATSTGNYTCDDSGLVSQNTTGFE